MWLAHTQGWRRRRHAQKTLTRRQDTLHLLDPRGYAGKHHSSLSSAHNHTESRNPPPCFFSQAQQTSPTPALSAQLGFFSHPKSVFLESPTPRFQREDRKQTTGNCLADLGVASIPEVVSKTGRNKQPCTQRKYVFWANSASNQKLVSRRPPHPVCGAPLPPRFLPSVTVELRTSHHRFREGRRKTSRGADKDDGLRPPTRQAARPCGAWPQQSRTQPETDRKVFPKQ